MPRTFEFLDLDGSYALVRPLDETRGRVVYSNVLEQGELLFKNPRLTWKEAGEDAGGCTRLGPSDFPQGTPKERDLDLEDFQGHEGDRILFDLLETSETPEAGPRLPGPSPEVMQPDGQEAPPDLLMHLVVHYLRMTEPGHDDGRWSRLCSCPEIRFQRRAATVLRDALSSALKARGLPRLERIILTLRAARAQEVKIA